MKHTVNWWATWVPDARIFPGDVFSAQFCRSRACDIAVELAEKAGLATDVIVIADGDTVMKEPGAVYMAVEAARNRMTLCYAHETRMMLGRQDTASVMSNGFMVGDAETTGPHWNTFSGCLAIGRPLWDAINGFDRRFDGWGFEDLAFMHAAGTLGELTRAPGGECWHLWHPRKHEEEEGQPHYLDNWAVWQEYVRANGDPTAMRALIEGTR